MTVKMIEGLRDLGNTLGPKLKTTLYFVFIFHTLSPGWFSFLSFLFLEIKRHPVFKRYERGEPTTRLYLKNLAKTVEEKVSLKTY